MESVFRACLVLALLGAWGVAVAGQLTDLPDGSIRHIPSGWVFPTTVDSFERVRPAQVIAGTTTDVMAGYKLAGDGADVVVTVYVYGTDSPAGDATFEGAKLAIDPRSKSFMVDQFAEGAFRVGSEPGLLGRKTMYKYGFGQDSSLDYLYFFETGKWIVKMRVTAAKLQKQTFQQIDGFVRSQRWDALGLTSATCTGVVCNSQQAIAHHSPLVEMLVAMLVDKEVPKPFPDTKEICDPAILMTAMYPKNKVALDGKPAKLDFVSSCYLSAGVQMSTFRVALSEELIRLEETESTDGLTLRDPLMFFALADGRKSYFTQMHDGSLTAEDVRRVMATIVSNRESDFAVGNKKGRDLKLKIRFQE